MGVDSGVGGRSAGVREREPRSVSASGAGAGKRLLRCLSDRLCLRGLVHLVREHLHQGRWLRLQWKWSEGEVKRLALIVALFLGACDSGDPEGPAATGAAGTGQAGSVTGSGGTGGLVAKPDASGAAGTGSEPAMECKTLPPCDLRVTINGKNRYSSPTCAGRLCGPCKNLDTSVVVGGCFIDDGTGPVYCEDRSNGRATDCN